MSVPLHPKLKQRKQIKQMKKLFMLMLWFVSTSGFAQQEMTIEQLFQRVRDNNKSMKAQQTAIDAAREEVKVAKSKRLPDINTQLSVSYNGDGFITDRDFTDYKRVDIPSFGNSFSIQASQAIYTGGALSSGIRMAEIGAEKAIIGKEQQAQALCFMALGQYLDLYKIDNQIKVYERNIDLTNKLIAQVSSKYEQGTALKNDITRYELQKEQLKLALQKMRDMRNIINHRLCTTLNFSDETTKIENYNYLTSVEKSLMKDDKNLGDWQTEASTNNLSIQQHNLNEQMAEQQTRMTKSELLPKVAIIATDNFNGPITIEIPAIDKNFNYWYAGIGVSYSLSSLFKSNKAIKKAKMAEVEAKQNREVEADRIENNMQEAYTMYQQSFVELSTQQKSVQLAQQNYDVINNRYLNQLALVTDMVDAENVKLQAELQEVNARINVVYAYYRMKFIANRL